MFLLTHTTNIVWTSSTVWTKYYLHWCFFFFFVVYKTCTARDISKIKYLRGVFNRDPPIFACTLRDYCSPQNTQQKQEEGEIKVRLVTPCVQQGLLSIIVKVASINKLSPVLINSVVEKKKTRRNVRNN